MKRNIIFPFLILLLSSNLYSQATDRRQAIDRQAIENWQTVEEPNISSDGRYVSFMIASNSSREKIAVITRRSDEKNAIIKGCISAPLFSGKTDQAFILTNNNLTICKLKNFYTSTLRDVSRFHLIQVGKKELLLTYSDSSKHFTIRDADLKKIGEYVNVHSYNLNEKAESIALMMKDKYDTNRVQTIVWINLKEGVIEHMESADQILFSDISNNDKYLAYVTEEPKSGRRKIWLKEREIKNPKLTFKDEDTGKLQYDVKFTQDNRRLLFKTERETKLDTSSVLLWSYRDMFLHGQRKPLGVQYNNNNDYYIYDIRSNQKARLGDDHTYIYMPERINSVALICPALDGLWFDEKSKDSLKVLNLNSGSLDSFLPLTHENRRFYISPDESFIVWFDASLGSWFSYEVSKGITRNISEGIPEKFYNEEFQRRGRRSNFGLFGWTDEGRSAIIADQYDIWEVALDLTSSPKNLTGGIGKKNRIELTIANPDLQRSYKVDEQLIIIGYDRESKNGGYFKLRLGNRFQFKPGHLYPFAVSSRLEPGFSEAPAGFVKRSEKCEIFLVMRENASTSPNLYLTADFNSYKRISSVYPEADYNFLTATLVRFKGVDGQELSGILYKPQDFKSENKYPVILNYYAKRSDLLHKYLKPAYSEGNINIPLFVNQGYLVFVPDVYSESGENGKGTFNSIEGAAKHLASLPFVDPSKIGIQGHSYGGWQTNYMITHSKRFAAACEAAGVSNQISAYNQLQYDLGPDRQQFYEMQSQGSPYGLNVTPWSSTELYLANSPVLKVDRISTPFLMMHNREDDLVPFEQSVEMFLAMRRARKQVWMLIYKNSGHQLSSDNAKDFHSKMLEFFDYLLKNKSAPNWMKHNNEI
ncbi:prolyl oligopeptidase family serine peptidase [Pedobacter sp. JY14-1]|uniref:alpha/beta hydrolase family protein n=1 Tax=Pedobacter sp. JY14-1 TaxID=3034151 RepID=UPI0023E14F65|nr:prolyl oligopeptidase family serine peptidase [Pedobacter sp. JY14-1]